MLGLRHPWYRLLIWRQREKSGRKVVVVVFVIVVMTFLYWWETGQVFFFFYVRIKEEIFSTPCRWRCSRTRRSRRSRGSRSRSVYSGSFQRWRTGYVWTWPFDCAINVGRWMSRRCLSSSTNCLLDANLCQLRRCRRRYRRRRGWRHRRCHRRRGRRHHRRGG